MSSNVISGALLKTGLFKGTQRVIQKNPLDFKEKNQAVRWID